jgi:type IV fimbrial biogenesis protein FimT
MMKYRGFTLVELIITMAIAAILTTVAVPSFTETIKRNRLATKTNLLVGSLGLARSEAIKRGQRVNVCVSSNQTGCTGGTNWAQGWLTWVDADNSNTLNGETIIHTVEALPASITFTGSASFVGFSPQGAAIVNNNTFTVCDDRTGETGRTITINATGRTNLVNLGCA